MLKITGILLIISAGALLGVHMAHKLIKRTIFYEDYIALITEAENRIKYDATPLDELFSAIHYSDGIDFILSPVRQEIKNGVNFHLAWENSVANAYSNKKINSSDKVRLLEFARGLGATDIDGQISHCELCLSNAKNALEGAYKDKIIKTKLYKTLGLLGGIAVGIMVI